MKRKLFLFAPVLFAVLVSQLSAQDAATPAAEPAPDEFYFDEAVEVNVVNVDVWVTDRQGEPITGLTKEDFEVYEDKRPVTITNFYAVTGGQPVAGGLAATTAELPVRDRDPLSLIPEDQRLSLIVYVDNFNIRPFNRNRVFRRLREFLQEQLEPGDRAMLVSYDRSLHVRHPFTTDPALIASATFDLEKLTGFAVHRDSDRRDLKREIEEAESLGEVQWRVQQFAESELNDLSFTLDALKEFVETLAGLPGRKALLYVSDGLEMIPAEDLFEALRYRFREQSMGAAQEYNATRKFRALAQAANANRVSFYTIDAAGLRVSSSVTAEQATASLPGLGAHVDSILFRNLQGSLQFLAEETGGLAIFNTNDIGESLKRVASGFKNYYSLGYSPAHAGDGRYYKIRVELKDKKKYGKRISVRHREGYRDKNTFSRMAEGTTSTLRYGLASNPLDVQISLGRGEERNKLFMVPISVTVPLSQVVLVQQDDAYYGRLKLFFSAMDDQGDMSDVQEVPLQLRIPADKLDQVMSQPFRLVQTELQMRRGGHRVAVGVRDELGASQSFVTREILVGG